MHELKVARTKKRIAINDNTLFDFTFIFISYRGSGAQAASYIHLVDQSTGKATYGVGISSNITRASIRGIFSAVNRLFY